MAGLMVAAGFVELRWMEVEAGMADDEKFVTDTVEVVVFIATVVELPCGGRDVVIGIPVVAAASPQAEADVSLTVTVLVVVDVIVVV